MLKNWCFWTVVLEKALKSPFDCKEIQPVHPKGNKSWIIIGTDAEAETPILWPPDAKNWLIWKDPDAGKDWRQEEKGPTGWDGWMASLTWCIWVWASSRSWWRIGKPGVLQSLGSQRVRHDWMTELNWTELNLTWFLGLILCLSFLFRKMRKTYIVCASKAVVKNNYVYLLCVLITIIILYFFVSVNFELHSHKNPLRNINFLLLIKLIHLMHNHKQANKQTSWIFQMMRD